MWRPLHLEDGVGDLSIGRYLGVSAFRGLPKMPVFLLGFPLKTEKGGGTLQKMTDPVLRRSKPSHSVRSFAVDNDHYDQHHHHHQHHHDLHLHCACLGVSKSSRESIFRASNYSPCKLHEDEGNSTPRRLYLWVFGFHSDHTSALRNEMLTQKFVVMPQVFR